MTKSLATTKSIATTKSLAMTSCVYKTYLLANVHTWQKDVEWMGGAWPSVLVALRPSPVSGTPRWLTVPPGTVEWLHGHTPSNGHLDDHCTPTEGAWIQNPLLCVCVWKGRQCVHNTTSSKNLECVQIAARHLEVNQLIFSQPHQISACMWYIHCFTLASSNSTMSISQKRNYKFIWTDPIVVKYNKLIVKSPKLRVKSNLRLRALSMTLMAMVMNFQHFVQIFASWQHVLISS